MGMLLLMLLIAVPVALALAVAIELADNRGERIDRWIEDAHPVFARPSDPSQVDFARARPVGKRATERAVRARAARTPNGRSQPRRRALPLH